MKLGQFFFHGLTIDWLFSMGDLWLVRVPN